MENNVSSFVIKEYLIRLEKYCAFQERSVYDLKLKMIKLGVPEEYHDRIIEELKENNFLSDERYADLYVRSKVNQNGWGPVKIRAELSKKHIANSLIEKYINLYYKETKQTEMLETMLNKKMKSLGNVDREKQKEKLIRFALSRGFESKSVFAVINKIFSGKD